MWSLFDRHTTSTMKLKMRLNLGRSPPYTEKKKSSVVFKKLSQQRLDIEPRKQWGKSTRVIFMNSLTLTPILALQPEC